MEYLFFWVSRYGVKPVDRKIQAVKNTKPPNYQK